MRQQIKPECRHKCRFLQITPTLWLCPHASYGWSSNLIGAVADARAALERAGGYDEMLAKVMKAEADKREAAKQERIDRGSPGPRVKYD